MTIKAASCLTHNYTNLAAFDLQWDYTDIWCWQYSDMHVL